MTDQKQSEARWILSVEWLGLLVIVALATFLRFWRIEEVPPGFNSDEAVGAMGALTTLREGLKYSYEGQGGGGALGFYFAAASFYLFGPSIAAIRGVAAWAGVMSIIFNYWAVREVFRIEGMSRARWLAGFSTLALSVSVWHIWPSRVAFATIGVPFLMLPSIYFLWRGLNHPYQRWTFYVSGLFLGSLLYIYLSGAFVPPLYAAFFIAQWLFVKLAHRFNWSARPPTAYLTTQFWNLFATGLTAVIVLLPIVFVLITMPNIDPNSTRVGQAIFTNPQINQGDPWGLLWRSTVGNFGAYGVSLSWLTGQPPHLVYVPSTIGFLVFVGFLITLWRGLRGRSAYLFFALWYPIMLLPSILSPDSIPHNLRTLGAATATYVFAAITILAILELSWAIIKRWLVPKWGTRAAKRLAYTGGLLVSIGFGWHIVQANQQFLYQYFYLYPQTNDAQAAFHQYAVELANVINREEKPNVAFVLPRNTAAGDINRNFTTDFLTELAQPPADHYWVVDDERTIADDLTVAAAEHSTIRVVEWKTSKHTGADPKAALDYYLEKYGYYDHKHDFEFFTIHTYQLQMPAPDFSSGEQLQPVENVVFGEQLKLTGYALGDAGDVTAVNQPQAHSNDLLWLRLGWKKIADHAENLKVSVLIYTADGQLVTQQDKKLFNNIEQIGSHEWPLGEETDTYLLLNIPPATPPGSYVVRLAVYGEESLNRLQPSRDEGNRSIGLANFSVVPAQRPAKAEQLDMALSVGREVLPGLRLIGFETLPGDTVRSGSQVGASVIWQAGSPPPTADVKMSLVAKAGEGKAEYTLSDPVPLAGADYPTSVWQADELLRGWLAARIPPALEPGLYELEMQLSSAESPDTEVVRLPIGEFTITGWPRNFEEPQPQVTVNATFGNFATLVGLDANTNSLTPGETLEVLVHWQAKDEFDRDYTSFVQLIGPDGMLYGQVDHTPGDGQFPTTGWIPGEYIADSSQVSLATDAPSGAYQVAVGMYNPNTGQRLPVTGGACQPDVCLLPGLTVN